MNQPLLILGAGGHTKVLINALQLQKIAINGILDPNQSLHGSEILGIPVLGDDTFLEKYKPNEIQLINGVGSIDSMQNRTQIFLKYKDLGFQFAIVIHPSAIIAPSVKLHEGCQIMAGVTIQPDCTIGKNTIINTAATIDHDCQIGDHVHIAPGVVLSGAVLIGQETHVGTGTVVIQNIKIGKNCILGAGSTVLSAISENSKVVGTPAKTRV